MAILFRNSGSADLLVPQGSVTDQAHDPNMEVKAFRLQSNRVASHYVSFLLSRERTWFATGRKQRLKPVHVKPRYYENLNMLYKL